MSIKSRIYDVYCILIRALRDVIITYIPPNSFVDNVEIDGDFGVVKVMIGGLVFSLVSYYVEQLIGLIVRHESTLSKCHVLFQHKVSEFSIGGRGCLLRSVCIHCILTALLR